MHTISPVCATDPSFPYTAKKAQEVNKIVSAPAKSVQADFRTLTDRLPSTWTSRGNHCCRPPHRFTSSRDARRPSTGLKRFDMALAHVSTNIPSQPAWCTPAGAEAGLSNLSGKQKFFTKTVVFVAYFPFSRKAASVAWWHIPDRGVQRKLCCVLATGGLESETFHFPRSLSFSEEKVQEQKEKLFLVSCQNGTIVARASLEQRLVKVWGAILPLSPGIWDTGKEGKVSLQCISPCSRRKATAFNSFGCQIFCKGITWLLESTIKRSFLSLSEHLQNKAKLLLFLAK